MKDKWKQRKPVSSTSLRSKPVRSQSLRAKPTIREKNIRVQECIEPTICISEIPCLPPGHATNLDIIYTSGFPYAYTFFDQWFATESDRDAGINELIDNIPRLIFNPNRPTINTDPFGENKGRIIFHAPTVER